MRVKLPVGLLSVAGITLSFWAWFPHLIAFPTCYFLLRGVLAAARSISPRLAAEQFSDELPKMSAAARSWFNRNAHAVVMWGAAQEMARTATLTQLAWAISVIVVSVKFSPWFLLELLLVFFVVYQIKLGFMPLHEASLDPKSSVHDEVMPVANRVFQRDLKSALDIILPGNPLTSANLSAQSQFPLPAGAEIIPPGTSSKQEGKYAIFCGVGGEDITIFLGTATLEQVQEYIFRTHPGAKYLSLMTASSPKSK